MPIATSDLVMFTGYVSKEASERIGRLIDSRISKSMIMSLAVGASTSRILSTRFMRAFDEALLDLKLRNLPLSRYRVRIRFRLFPVEILTMEKRLSDKKSLGTAPQIRWVYIETALNFYLDQFEMNKRCLYIPPVV